MGEVDVVIQGGGIAGLALARSLLDGGLSVSVVECRSTLETGGAGILLQENALKALSCIGVSAGDLGGGHSIKRINLGTRDCPKAMSIAVKGRALGLPRYQLLNCLQAGVDSDCVALNTTIKAWTKLGDGRLNVELSDGGRRVCRVIVAADGAHSTLRERVQQHKTRYRETGQHCWRFLLDDIDHDSESYELQNGRSRLGFIPTAGRQLYVYLTESSLDEESAARRGWREVQDSINGFGSMGKVIAQRIDSETTFLRHPIIDGPVFMPVGPDIIFMGDAAHPMTPNLGQGAAMALEDAAILGPLLRTRDPECASKLFCRLRHRRVARLCSLSYWAGAVAHVSNPGLRRLRTLGLQCIPAAVVQYQQQVFNRSFYRQLKRMDCDLDTET
ncbi:FAD-dependent monooxygenase [Zobellella sp. DQSA1]|uniref:FAD-dependent monooxygenase n=1 Tax=Zobellella sp. DQSA1 TaxID=3342386 RepID=UPI0035BFEE39